VPLEKVRVLDLTRLLPGGYCTLLLADLGADVVKVEEPGRGDYIRWTPPLVDGVGAAHRALNRDKRSVTLNLKRPEGAGALRQMVRSFDVLVESFRPGVLDRLGVGYEALSKENPGLVFCAITGYGQDGPYRDVVGHDINYLGFGGVLSMTGPAGGDPVVPGVQVGDLGGGALLGAVGILAALLDRERTGRGRFVDTAILDGVVSWLSIHAGTFLATREHLAGGTAPLSGGYACYGIYRTRDGRHLSVGALEPQFWRALCRTLGCPELIDHQYGPPEQQAEMRDTLQAAFAERDRQEWMATFSGIEACVGPVNDLAETLADPQVRHRRMVARIAGEAVGPGSPFKLLDGEAREPRPAPGLGEHTAQVLAEAGFSSEEVATLRTSGAL
jgi:crotonobetainyl-CoA:carnitine CoA-transferase CaiB-like acyl-CoA transferase